MTELQSWGMSRGVVLEIPHPQVEGSVCRDLEVRTRGAGEV